MEEVVAVEESVAAPAKATINTLNTVMNISNIENTVRSMRDFMLYHTIMSINHGDGF